MCGLFGFIGGEEIDLAKKINQVQGHRGPDFQGVFSDKWITLAHQRLSIIDISEKSNQPFIKENFVIVFNGEIYNYKELRQNFKNTNQANFKTTSDTEVVLEYYRKYKEKCLDYFIGMFAFAIYDLENKTVFIARDHFGIKPLFYTQIGENFAFASELKSLIEIPGFKKELNIKNLISSLNYVWVPGNESMLKGCHKLPPAHYIIVDSNLKVSVKRYYNLPSNEAVEKNERHYIEALDYEMTKSIERHMVADVPISSFLSGGLDSSLIAAMATRHTNKLSTYTIGTSQKDKKIEKMPADELYAKKIANLFNFDHNEIVIKSDIVNELPKMVYSLDEPIGDPAAINTFLICKAARDKGVKVLLSGMGADEIFFGYRRMKANLMVESFNNLPWIFKAPIKSGVKILPVKAFGKGVRFSRWSKKFISFADIDKADAYRMSYSYYNQQDIINLVGSENHTYYKEIVDEHNSFFNNRYVGDSINQMCYTDINMFMAGLNLTYTDRSSMAASVEVRVPFIDKKIIELAMKIPGSLKYRNKESKYILKKVAEKYLPKQIIYRPKASFGAPIRSWISNDLSEMVGDLLSTKQIKERGLLDNSVVQKMINDDRKGKHDYAYQIYQLLTIELWFRNFMD